MAHAEISAHMNAPLGTVKSWLRRGISRLHDHIAHDAAVQVKPSRHDRFGRNVSAQC
jgi:DNA-directed RNA polymerase specialized sigma24 family protein